ncbi:hypothetical protein FLB_15070 [Flavobacterium succinicans]|uniref:Uncharacterized protein n=1 Tax=Flavobacterium succinicans TaxID=29536 RepID=A0A199XR67_9FLAO|nr:hypothetical protein FLB_15070 [Flavobacterium succinicans]
MVSNVLLMCSIYLFGIRLEEELKMHLAVVNRIGEKTNVSSKSINLLFLYTLVPTSLFVICLKKQ